MEIILVGLLLAIGLGLLARGIVCWYWKINIRTDLLKKQNELLEGIYAKLGGGAHSLPMDVGSLPEPSPAQPSQDQPSQG